MKVICIFTDPRGWYKNTVKIKGPEFGDVDTVTGEIEVSGDRGYSLDRFGHNEYYSVKHFTPVDEVEEKEYEAIKNKKLETA
jgi:hypothetical protein